jgi:hypothetical protein
LLALPREEVEVVIGVVPRLLTRDVLASHDWFLLNDGRYLLVLGRRVAVTFLVAEEAWAAS